MKISKFLSTLILLLCISFSIVAQTSGTEQENTAKKTTVIKPRAYIENASIKEQFEYMMEKSSRYKTYKVIEITWLKKFESGFVDSLNAIRQNFLASEKLAHERDETIKSLHLELNKTKKVLTNLQQDKDSMTLFGIQMSKLSYNVFIWCLVVGLLVITVFFFLLFKRSNSVTKETKVRLNEVRDEFETHRKNALVREQKLARRLQDEINKNRNLGM